MVGEEGGSGIGVGVSIGVGLESEGYRSRFAVESDVTVITSVYE